MKIKWGARWKGYVYPPPQKPYIIESEIKMLSGIVSWLVKADRSWVEFESGEIWADMPDITKIEGKENI